MKKLSLFLLLFALPSLSRAQLVLFEAHLTAGQENPPTASTATGFGTASLDLATDWFIFNDTFSGLTGGSTASHIHSPGAVGTNGPVLIPFGIANGFVAGSTSGSVSFSGTLTPMQAQQLLGGLFYANVHTANFPGGEIRGQLLQVSSPVPEPSTYAFGGVAVLGFLALRRFRASRAVSKV